MIEHRGMHNLRDANCKGIKNCGQVEKSEGEFRARSFSVSSSCIRPLPSSSSPLSMPSGYSIIDRSAVISSVCRDRSKCLEHCHCIGGTILLLLLLLRFAINAMDISLHRSLATILSPQLNRREKSEARQKASGFYIPSL